MKRIGSTIRQLTPRGGALTASSSTTAGSSSAP